MENKPPEQGTEAQPEQGFAETDRQEIQTQDGQPPEQAEKKTTTDPYWVNRVPVKIFHTICLVLGTIFALTGAIFLIFLDALAGFIITSCGGMLLLAGISGLREQRRQDDES